MKKLLIGLLALCLVFGFAVGMNAAKARVAGSAISPDPVASAEEGTPAPETPAEPAPEETEAEAPAEAAAPAGEVPEIEGTASGRIDYEALYQLHAPEEKVLKVNDREESWGDYFYILFTQCGQIHDGV